MKMAFEDRIRLPTSSLIHRRLRLLDILTESVDARHRLITIYAPGGYGKTMLLADYAQTTDLPVCWCSLEPVDRDPASFLTLLAHSITDRFHEIEPHNLLGLVQQGNTEASIRRIAASLSDVGSHLIIIDDYHKAVSAGMTLALNKLLEQLPPAGTIIVAARGSMNLETGQIIDLLVSERASGLSEEELRFTAEEVQLVMRKRFGRRIDLDSATHIAKATDGNIAQILLAGHAMHTGKILDRLAQRLGDDQTVIYNYLAEEVFDKQPPYLQDFLLETAVLPDMAAELCNELLDIDDSQSNLEELVRRDLFVAQVGAGLRYHDLFGGFLRDKLAEDRSRYRDVSIRAADLLAARSRVEEAVYLYLSVQAWDEAAALLEGYGSNFYHAGRALTLDSWLSQIPDSELRQRPRLLLLHGQILGHDLGQPEVAFEYFQQAKARFRQRDDLPGLAEAHIQQSSVLRALGRPPEALQAAIIGLEFLEAGETDKRLLAHAVRCRGLANWMAGHIEEALIDLRRALDLAEQLKDSFNVARGHQDVGICLEKKGNISAAEHHFQQALRLWESLGNANDLANTLNSLGVCAYLRRNYDEALKRLDDSLQIALQINNIRRAAYAQATIGDVYLAKQRYPEALDAYAHSSDLAKNVVRSLEIYNTAKMGECFFDQNELFKALNLATKAKEIATESGLNFENGLATVLQAKIYTRRAEYEASLRLFSEAVAIFSENDVLEQAKACLWWGYTLLLDLRSYAAYEQLQKVISLALSIGELIQSLGPTVAETMPLLLHFSYRTDIPLETRKNIQLLLDQVDPSTMPGECDFQVFAFGTPYLVLGDQRRHFSQRGGVRKVPEFLLYLLVEGQESGCRWSEVSLALWPDLDKDKASAMFHQTLRRLRTNIFGNRDYILVEDDYYRINPDYLQWVDVLAFDQLYTRLTGPASQDALALQFELINLYQGEFLAGFELGDWGQNYRTVCEMQYLQIVQLTSEQLLRTGSPQGALTVAMRGLDHDYFREELHRLALEAYAAAGLYDDLAAHYERLWHVFEQEMAAPPHPQTTQLYRQLMESR